MQFFNFVFAAVIFTGFGVSIAQDGEFSDQPGSDPAKVSLKTNRSKRYVARPAARFETGYQWVRAYRSWILSQSRNGWRQGWAHWDYYNYFQYRYWRYFEDTRLVDLDFNERARLIKTLGEYFELLDQYFGLPMHQQKTASDIMSWRYQEDEDYTDPGRRYFPSSEAYRILEQILKQLRDEVKRVVDAAGDEDVGAAEANIVFLTRYALNGVNDDVRFRVDRVNREVESIAIAVRTRDELGMLTQDSPTYMGSEGLFAQRNAWGRAKSFDDVIDLVGVHLGNIQRDLQAIKIRLDQARARNELKALGGEPTEDLYWLLTLAHKLVFKAEHNFHSERDLRNHLGSRISFAVEEIQSR